MSQDSLIKETLYHILDGDELVFQRIFTSGHCDGNADDVFTLSLGYAVPLNSTSFSLRDSDLVSAHCHVHHTSVWLNDFYPVSIGSIEGDKIDEDIWAVRGSVTYTIPLHYPKVETISFNELFRQ